MTLTEVVVTGAVVCLVLLISFPLVLRAIQKARGLGCSFNLRALGTAVESYQNSHAGRLPVGARYQSQPESPWGGSWWVDILPHLGQPQFGVQGWKSTIESSGDFAHATANPNITTADGFALGSMFCPSSPLPVLNRPADHISAASRAELKTVPRGIAVPSYVAIAGSAPDMRLLDGAPLDAPHGRNTRDGRLGILSASGAFPPNQGRQLAHITDGQQFTILLGEQSMWGMDRQFEPPVLYDLRSSWPRGAYAGSEGNYQQLSVDAEGLDGSGDARCTGVTTLRYPPNTLRPTRGILAQPISPTPAHPSTPPLASIDDERGPGHNHGLNSPHVGGVNVLMADGSVRFLSDDIDLRVLLLHATRDDGQQ